MYQYKLKKDEDIRLTREFVSSGGHIPHTHDFIEIAYISGGSGTHIVNDTPYPVKRGDLIFINFKEVHSYTTDKTMEFINCLISP